MKEGPQAEPMRASGMTPLRWLAVPCWGEHGLRPWAQAPLTHLESKRSAQLGSWAWRAWRRQAGGTAGVLLTSPAVTSPRRPGRSAVLRPARSGPAGPRPGPARTGPYRPYVRESNKGERREGERERQREEETAVRMARSNRGWARGAAGEASAG